LKPGNESKKNDLPTLYKNNAKTNLESKVRAYLLSGLSCGQSRSPARTVFIRDVGKHLKNRTMKIKFNEKEKSIEIKDGLKTQYLVVKMTLIFTLINSILFPVFVLDKKQLEWMGFVWIILGLASMTMLIYQILKKSASEKLNLSEISSLTEKQIFGRKRFSLKLKNGKLRDLMELKNESDIIETKKLFTNIGIETN
jgi:NADH:ubiquinone oxidoreductase subunit 3 (subunit A)